MPLFIKLTKTGEILRILKFIAWIAFLGFAIGAGAYLISDVVVLFKPESIKNVYKGFGLYELYQYNFWYYSLMALIVFALTSIKAVVWFMVAKIISKIEMKNPFKREVSCRLEFISYALFTICLIALLGNIYINILSYIPINVQGKLNAKEFLFTAGLVFIISQIFKRGVELQSENELTV